MNTKQAADQLQKSFDYISTVFPVVEKRRPGTIAFLDALSCAIAVLRVQPVVEAEAAKEA